jgi:hypothetical protein
MSNPTRLPGVIFILGAGLLILRSLAPSGSPSVLAQSQRVTGVQRYQQMITAEGLAARLYFLASDFFEGRETTTRGQKLAANYLASEYRKLGLLPRGSASEPLSPSAYLQTFPIYRKSPKQTRLTVSVDGSEKVSSEFSIDVHDDQSFFATGDPVDAAGGVVFAGYGIADDKLSYNDYAALSAKGISLADKWVMILDDEPLADGKTSLLPAQDRKPSRWSTQFIIKKSALWRAGRPKGVLVVADVSPRTTTSFAERSAAAARNLNRVGGIGLAQTAGFPPTFDISTKLANQILEPSGRTIDQLTKQINSTLKPEVFEVSERVKVTATVTPFPALSSENVLAFIEGSDPKLQQEVVVISSHYDHLGLNPTLTGDQIFNGAADDGSGVVASLELAQQFMNAKRDGVGPRRSLLFINFTGEEKGLLGSTYYTQSQPVVPLDQIVADINMDGVGGIDLRHPTKSRNYIYVIADETLSGDLAEVTKQVNSKLVDAKLELTPGPPFSSDQLSFASQLVPYLYFSTGLTEHYHQVSDEPKTIDYDHLARVTQLIFGAAWEVANRDSTPPRTDRSRLTITGYVCPPCPFECDDQVYDHPGECPVCGMVLAPKYDVRRASR